MDAASDAVAMVLDRDLADRLVEAARSAGFDLAGFTDLVIDERDRAGLDAFVHAKRFGEMEWFARHQSLRLDPGRLLRHESHVTGRKAAEESAARSAMVLGMVYVDREYEALLNSAPFRISRYAAGRDYHKVLRQRAQPLVHLIEERGGEARVCVDSVPIPEKVLARKAGLGWQGKHTNLIHPRLGSWFFLCVILLSCEIDTAVTVPNGSLHEVQGQPVGDLCRDCRLCVTACPTGALSDYQIDARRCLSYITIEASTDRRAQSAQRRGWVFGCDICQEVCPYNRSPRGRSVKRSVDDFAPRRAVIDLLAGMPDEAGWSSMEGTALRRISLEQMRVNFEMAREGRAGAP